MVGAAVVEVTGAFAAAAAISDLVGVMSVTPVDDFGAAEGEADFDAGAGERGGEVLVAEEEAVKGFFGSTGAGPAVFVAPTFSSGFVGGVFGGATGGADTDAGIVTGTAAPTGIHSACHGRMADEFERV